MIDQPPSRDATPDPAELRGIFGANLRQLCKRYTSVAGLCRDLGINRTQFNRYLSGESFPRPDVLHRICQFFNVDARVLLEPVEHIHGDESGLLHHPEVREFLGPYATRLPEAEFPSGFYRFSRASFFQADRVVIGLVYVFRRDGFAFIRGYEPREAFRNQGIPATPENREFRGILLKQELGVAALIARRRANTCSFNFLVRSGSFEHNYWTGYVIRTIAENPTSQRVARMVFEHLPNNTPTVLRAARECGLKPFSALSPFHARILRLDAAFA